MSFTVILGWNKRMVGKDFQKPLKLKDHHRGPAIQCGNWTLPVFLVQSVGQVI